MRRLTAIWTHTNTRIAIGGLIALAVVAMLLTVLPLRDRTEPVQSSSLCVTGGAVSPGNAALAADCDTLLGMKAVLRGSATLNWWTGRALERWDGVVLGGGRIVEVSLPNRSLDGIIPAGFDIGRLSALTTLDLSSNSLRGTIPSEIGSLRALQSLSLDSNNLTGEIPAQLNNLTGLTRWRLAGNSFTGCLPSRLALVTDNDITALGIRVCEGTPPPRSETN